MYIYFQPRMSVSQEEADIKEMIDKEYKLKSMKKVLLILLSTLLFISCERISIENQL